MRVVFTIVIQYNRVHDKQSQTAFYCQYRKNDITQCYSTEKQSDIAQGMYF